MTTITEILAEARRRIKTEHGAELRSVEFKADGDVALTFTEAVTLSLDALGKRPDGATHVYNNQFWASKTYLSVYVWHQDDWAPLANPSYDKLIPA